MWELLWDIHQQRRIGDLEREAEKAVRQADRLAARTERLGDLRARVDKLMLINMALWEILKRDRPDLTDEDLLAEVRRIDLLDGRLDGRHRPSPEVSRCPRCERVMSRTNRRCLYCGDAALYDDTEDLFS